MMTSVAASATTLQPCFEGTLMAPVTYAVKGNAVHVGGVPVSELMATYGSPLYVMDAATVRDAARAYTQTLAQQYAAPSLVVYACKANLSVGLAKLMQQEGLGLDVVSAGELHTAITAGFPAERILFNGNNKSKAEMAMALDYGVNRFVVDNASELDRLASVAQAQGKVANILLRVAPGIECHTHEYIRTGQNDSKFGFPLEELEPTVGRIVNEFAGVLCLKGLQGHVGSQIFEVQAYVDLANLYLGKLQSLHAQFGVVLEDLDLGGGLGMAYTTADDPPVLAEAVALMATTVTEGCKALGLALPRLILEPGRSLVARAGVTLYTVGSSKHLSGYPSFWAVDGGMGDNIRPALYQAQYSALVANKLNEPLAPEPVRLVGKYCESGDILLREFHAPALAEGDTVMVLGTGAYNYAMASHYNRFSKPAMVLVEDGQHGLLVARESLDDLLAQDRVPAWL